MERHTSGSTGNKKLVPHLLEDLVVGAICIAAACQLEPSDVCCNQMPLYHIGGIARNVLAPILSGGSVVAMPFFEPSLFWKVATASQATWYYAGPTMVRYTNSHMPSHALYPAGQNPTLVMT